MAMTPQQAIAIATANKIKAEQTHPPGVQQGPTVQGFAKDQWNQFKEDVSQTPRAPGIVMDYLKQNKEPLMKMLPDVLATGLTLTPWGAPMQAAKAANMVSKVPAAIPLISDAIIPPILDVMVRKGFSTIARNAIRFSPSIAASGIGGAGGSLIQDMTDEQKISSLEEEPTLKQINAVMDKAAKEAGRQMSFEIGGDAIFRGFEKLFLPNAELLSKQGNQVIKFARDNKLPLLPSNTTGTRGWVESIIESFAPSGYKVKSRVEDMARLLEAPVSDSSAFIWKLFQKEGKNIPDEILVDPQFRAVNKFIQSSIDEVRGLQRIGNNTTPGLTGSVLNGDKLLRNIAGADKYLDPETYLALENLALYAKTVHRNINQFAKGSDAVTKGFQAAQGAATLGITGLILGPLVSSKGDPEDPLIKAGPVSATVPDIALATAALPIAEFLAASITNPKSNLFRWVSTGAVDGVILKNLIRADMTSTVRMKGREYQGEQELERSAKGLPSKPPYSLPSDLGFDALKFQVEQYLNK